MMARTVRRELLISSIGRRKKKRKREKKEEKKIGHDRVDRMRIDR